MWGKQVRIEKSCSGDRQSGSTRVLQFCWTGTAEREASEVPEGRVAAAKG